MPLNSGLHHRRESVVHQPLQQAVLTPVLGQRRWVRVDGAASCATSRFRSQRLRARCGFAVAFARRTITHGPLRRALLPDGSVGPWAGRQATQMSDPSSLSAVGSVSIKVRVTSNPMRRERSWLCSPSPLKPPYLRAWKPRFYWAAGPLPTGDFGVGVRFRVGKNLFFRVEVRDFITESPDKLITPSLDADIGSILHNLTPMFGFTWIF